MTVVFSASSWSVTTPARICPWIGTFVSVGALSGLLGRLEAQTDVFVMWPVAPSRTPLSF